MANLVPVEGVKLLSGRQAYMSPEAAEWLYWRQEWQKAKFGRAQRIVQAAGGATASAGTHSDGAAIDGSIWDLTAGQRDGMIAGDREAGGAAWWRKRSQGFDPHTHTAIDIARWSACKYQVDAWKAGYNGLGYAGKGGGDDSPRPRAFRNYKEGVAWFKADIARIKKAEAEEDVEVITEKDMDMIALKVWQFNMKSGGDKMAAQVVAESGLKDAHQSDALIKLASRVDQIAKALPGVKADESTIVQGVVAGLQDKLHGAIVDGIREELKDIEKAEAETIANIVLDKLSQRVAA